MRNGGRFTSRKHRRVVQTGESYCIARSVRKPIHVSFGPLPRLARPRPLEPGTSRDTGLVDRRLLGNKLVAQVGVGAIGSWMDWFLASDGVRHFRIVDPDKVEVSNLYGRTAYRPCDVGRRKVAAISGVLRENMDPSISVEPIAAGTGSLTVENLVFLFSGANLALLTFDDPRELLKVSSFCYARVPTVFAAMHRGGTSGHLIYTVPGVTPCLMCSMGVSGSADITQLHAEPALPADIQRVTREFARITVSILCKQDQPGSAAAGLLDSGSNFMFINNRNGDGSEDFDIEWVPTERRNGCVVCRNVTKERR